MRELRVVEDKARLFEIHADTQRRSRTDEGEVMHVLVVEHDPRIASDVSRTLEASGYEVETVANGEEVWFLGDTAIPS
jgi:uncharacterized protein (DUF2249 family)